MKLILQIAIGVFIGMTLSHLATDAWRDYKGGKARQQSEMLRAEQERARQEQGERIRALLLQGRQGGASGSPSKPPSGFVPDDERKP